MLSGIDQTIALLTKDTLQVKSAASLFLPTLVFLVPSMFVVLWWISNYTNMPLRSDYLSAITQLFVLAKQMIPLLLAVTLLPMLKILYYPDSKLGRTYLFPLAVLILLDGVIIAELLVQPQDTWVDLMVGKTPKQCFLGVIAISLVILVANFYLLKRGIVTRPILTGFLAGVVAGCIGVVSYAFLCVEDSPLFYGLWYSFVVIMVGCLGALLGNKVLHW